jgi:PKD repeat protein
MMQLSFWLAVINLAGSLSFVPVVNAQTEDVLSDQPVADTNNPAATTVAEGDIAELAPVPLMAEAGADKNVAVGRNVLFDASGSTGPTDKTLAYTWDFGDGQQFQGIDASHIYNEPGTYKAKLTVSDGTTTSKDSVVVLVAEDVVLMVVDDSVSRDTVRYYKNYAQRTGTLLVTVRPKHSSSLDYAVSRSLAEQLIAAEDDVSQAKVVVVWTEKNIGLNALAEAARIVSGGESGTPANFSFSQKAIVRVEDKLASSALARLAQTTYNTVEPSYILLTTVDALERILAQPNTDTLTDTLTENGFSYKLIGRYSQRALETIGPLNFLSFGINYLMNRGVSQDTIFLLLILPVVATLVSFGRQIVGVKAFGIYIPSLLTLTFVITGLDYGLIIFTALLLAATVARVAVRRLHLLYMPRMAIVLTIVSITIFSMFVIASYFEQASFLGLSIFPILVMIILSEKFVEAQIEQGNRSAILLTIETLALATVSYLIVSWDSFETLLLAYPELVLLTLVINLALGRFSGLRIVEYFRFHRLLKPADKN